jgi:uncharacterized iron-regulated membrane protein
MTRRLIGQIHLWTGLALCLPLVLIGLTGSILVFEDQLRAAFAPVAQAQSGEARAVDAIIAAARAAAPPGFVPSSGFVAPAPGRFATVRLSPPGRQAGPAEGARVDVDPVSLVAYPNASDDFLRQVFFLHSTLLLKTREGRQLVGWLGVAMLVMGVSGLINWWPRRGSWRAAFQVSREAQGFRLWRELHGVAGIWGLLVSLTVTFGGIYLAFPETVRSAVATVLPARDLRAAAAAVTVTPIKGAEPLGIDEAIALARAEMPEGSLSSVFLPTRPDQPYRIALHRPGDDRLKTPVTVFVDPWARRAVETFDPSQFSVGENFLAAQHALHSGHGFGPVWKILVFLCGLLPTLFAATGIAMWLKRRRSTTEIISIIDHTARGAGE